MESSTSSTRIQRAQPVYLRALAVAASSEPGFPRSVTSMYARCLLGCRGTARQHLTFPCRKTSRVVHRMAPNGTESTDLISEQRTLIRWRAIAGHTIDVTATTARSVSAHGAVGEADRETRPIRIAACRHRTRACRRAAALDAAGNAGDGRPGLLQFLALAGMPGHGSRPAVPGALRAEAACPAGAARRFLPVRRPF